MKAWSTPDHWVAEQYFYHPTLTGTGLNLGRANSLEIQNLILTAEKLILNQNYGE